MMQRALQILEGGASRVAISMDGNGRWARGDCRASAGHRAGADAVRRTAEAARACDGSSGRMMRRMIHTLIQSNHGRASVTGRLTAAGTEGDMRKRDSVECQSLASTRPPCLSG